MKTLTRHLWMRILAAALCFGVAASLTTSAATYSPPRFDRPALDSMLAPIALYPDRLLSHVLMAATYPQEVEAAAHWLRARPGLSGDAAVRTAEGFNWDPSVRSLLAFPVVLDTMGNYMRWTEDLGEAFLNQREEVIDVIQFLRRRAYEAGTLRSNDAIRVVDTGFAIVIEAAVPQSVYVPYYDPRVTYGAWWWPARPPVYWSPWPGYHGRPGRPDYFIWGPAIHISSGFFFGDFVWARREVRVVDVRPYYYPQRVIVERHVVPGHPAPYVERRVPAPGIWKHDPRRRVNDQARAARRANEERDTPQRFDRDPRREPDRARAARPPARAADGVRPVPGEVNRPQAKPPADGRERAGQERPPRARERDEAPDRDARSERREVPRATEKRDGDGRGRRPEAPGRGNERGDPGPGPRSEAGPARFANRTERTPSVRDQASRDRGDTARRSARADRLEQSPGVDRLGINTAPNRRQIEAPRAETPARRASMQQRNAGLEAQRPGRRDNSD